MFQKITCEKAARAEKNQKLFTTSDFFLPVMLKKEMQPVDRGLGRKGEHSQGQGVFCDPDSSNQAKVLLPHFFLQGSEFGNFSGENLYLGN